jgi:hypothetical protein
MSIPLIRRDDLDAGCARNSSGTPAGVVAEMVNRTVPASCVSQFGFWLSFFGGRKNKATTVFPFAELCYPAVRNATAYSSRSKRNRKSTARRTSRRRLGGQLG